jgi:hypothetical protein
MVRNTKTNNSKIRLAAYNEHTAEQCGASWLNVLVVATKVETKFEYKIC